MRTSGFSIRQIMTFVLLASIVLILAITLLGESIGPQLSYKAVMRKENAQHGSEAVATASGTWLHLENDFIHFNSVVDKRHVNGVTRYQFDQHHKLEAVYYAKSLTLKDKQWMLQEVVKTSFY